jgi:diguanylate cyclase
LPETIARLLAWHAIAPSRLEVQITRPLQTDPGDGNPEPPERMGSGLAVDDFGSDYSSLADLKRLPIAVIKIDHRLVMNMELDENDAVIVRSTVDLGRNLALQVVAEGVANGRTWSELKRLGCHLAHGYFLSPPIPGSAVVAWLEERGVSGES